MHKKPNPSIEGNSLLAVFSYMCQTKVTQHIQPSIKLEIFAILNLAFKIINMATKSITAPYIYNTA